MKYRRGFLLKALAILLLVVALFFVGREWLIRTARVARPYVPTSFEQLYQDSVVVIIGSATTTSQSVEVGYEPMTLIGVDVTQSLKGSFSMGELVPVLQYDHWQDPHIANGEFVLLFLDRFQPEDGAEPAYIIKGLSDGHYKIQGDTIIPSLMTNEDMEAELRRVGFSLSSLLTELEVLPQASTPSILPTPSPAFALPERTDGALDMPSPEPSISPESSEFLISPSPSEALPATSTVNAVDISPRPE